MLMREERDHADMCVRKTNDVLRLLANVRAGVLKRERCTARNTRECISCDSAAAQWCHALVQLVFASAVSTPVPANLTVSLNAKTKT